MFKVDLANVIHLQRQRFGKFLIPATDLLNEALAHPMFDVEFSRVDLVQAKGFTNQEVLRKLREGGTLIWDAWTPWSPWSSADAKENKGVIYLSTRQNWIAAEVAATTGHERCHTLGWGHSFLKNSTRDQTVPYAIGITTRKVLKALGKWA